MAVMLNCRTAGKGPAPAVPTAGTPPYPFCTVCEFRTHRGRPIPGL